MDKILINQLIEDTKKLVLLYVESDEIVAQETLKFLERYFVNIIYVKSGEDGLVKFNENRIDLIITDVHINDLDGFEMLKKIDILFPKIPTIITAGKNDANHYQDILRLNIKGYFLKPIDTNDILDTIAQIVEDKKQNDIKNEKFNFLIKANKRLIDIGYQISNQKDHNKLLETILFGAKELSGADGGTLYLFNKENQTLEFKIAINSSLNIHYGGTKETIKWPALHIYNKDKTLNNTNVAVVCVTEDKLVNIHDIYHSTTFDFTGAKNFDVQNDYKTSSMLVIPMRNKDNELVGVIQLINKIKEEKIISFSKDDEALITSLASQATIVLVNNKLVSDLENLLYGLVKSVGSALNEKSQYTGKHVDKVAILSSMLVKAVDKNETTYKDVSFSSIEIEELRLAAWLHDIGKITTPEYVVDKATRLETIYDRINVVEARFEILKRDIEILFLKNEITADDKLKKLNIIEENLQFISIVNSGDTFMTNAHLEKLNNIALENNILINNKEISLILEDELNNLSIIKGTLTNKERDVINNHVVMSYNMLKELPFPKKFENVPKIAGSHHKTIDGKGYAAQELKDMKMSIRDKILAVADIFEALSAHDRPYRGPNTLSQIANILVNMVKDKAIDKDLVKLFFEEKLYLEYAKEHLASTQIDEIDIDFSKL